MACYTGHDEYGYGKGVGRPAPLSLSVCARPPAAERQESMANKPTASPGGIVSKVTQLVIYAEFMVFIACGAGMCLIPKYHRQGKYITRMLWDAWMDGKAGRLGKNKKYVPN